MKSEEILNNILFKLEIENVQNKEEVAKAIKKLQKKGVLEQFFSTPYGILQMNITLESFNFDRGSNRIIDYLTYKGVDTQLNNIKYEDEIKNVISPLLDEAIVRYINSELFDYCAQDFNAEFETFNKELEKHLTRKD